MKVKPQLYAMTLDLSARLAPAVPDWRAMRERRRMETGARAWLALREVEATTYVPSAASPASRARRN